MVLRTPHSSSSVLEKSQTQNLKISKMVLSLFGLLVDPTDVYTSKGHKLFSNGLVWVITKVVGGVTPIAFILLPILLLSWTFGLSDLSNISLWTRRLIIGVSIWCAMEIVFYFYCRGLKKRFEVKTSYPGLLSHKERQHYANRVLDHCPDPWSSLSGWFYQHHPDDIGRECVDEWLSWAFYSKNLEDLDETQRAELATLVAPIISKCAKLDKPAVEGKLNFMRLHFDKLVVQHKPFIAYVVSKTLINIQKKYILRNLFDFMHKVEQQYIQFRTITFQPKHRYQNKMFLGYDRYLI